VHQYVHQREQLDIFPLQQALETRESWQHERPPNIATRYLYINILRLKTSSSYHVIAADGLPSPVAHHITLLRTLGLPT